MAYLTLKNINKIYPNGFHAVHDFNLEMEKGEFIVLSARQAAENLQRCV